MLEPPFWLLAFVDVMAFPVLGPSEVLNPGELLVVRVAVGLPAAGSPGATPDGGGLLCGLGFLGS